MKKVLVKSNLLKPVLVIAMLCFTAFNSNGQQIKPAESGYAPVNGIKVYYEVYGKGTPIILLHGAFYTIELNWSELIPELSKTRKVTVNWNYDKGDADMMETGERLEKLMSSLKFTYNEV